MTTKDWRSMRNSALATSAALFTLVHVSAADATPIYTAIDVPGAVSTIPNPINDMGVIAGSWFDTSRVSHGFVRYPDGSIVTFDPAGSVDTSVSAINDRALIVGSYLNGNNTQHGFVRKGNGKIVTFDPPGSGGTTATAINKSGQIAGFYGGPGGNWGFIRERNGTFTTFSVSGASDTNVLGINASGAVAGYYSLSGVLHGFERTPDGQIVSFDPLGSTQTITVGISDKGMIAGWFLKNSDFDSQGYLRGVDGSFTVINVPESIPGTTQPININSEGGMIGVYSPSTGVVLGFLLSERGRYFSLLKAFLPSGINKAGSVTGYENGPSGVEGFVRSKD